MDKIRFCDMIREQTFVFVGVTTLLVQIKKAGHAERKQEII